MALPYQFQNCQACRPSSQTSPIFDSLRLGTKHTFNHL
jgi:hypothetical protein